MPARRSRCRHRRDACSRRGAADAEFDADKVARIAQAIADGSFKINAEAIADKLIANAQELLVKVQKRLMAGTTEACPRGRPYAASSKPASLAVETRPGRARQRAARARRAGDRPARRRAAPRAGAARSSQFSDAARDGPVPPALRKRLASASGQVAAQRESLARATAALDRAIDVLLPRDAATLYARKAAPSAACTAA